MNRAHAALCLCLLGMAGILATPTTTGASPIALYDQNSSADVQPAAPNFGWDTWLIEGQNQVTEQVYWIRWAGRSDCVSLGANVAGYIPVVVESATVNANIDDPRVDRLATRFTYESVTPGVKFSVTVEYGLFGGDTGTDIAQTDVNIKIRNLGTTPLPILLYQYTDIQAAQTAAGDSLTFDTTTDPARPVIHQWEGGTEVNTSNNYIASLGSTVALAMNFGDAATLRGQFSTANLLFADERSQVDGDAAYVLQWNCLIGAGKNVQIGEQTMGVVPEPTTLALLAVGGSAALGLRCRARRNARQLGLLAPTQPAPATR